jgi:hypothetical protein
MQALLRVFQEFPHPLLHRVNERVAFGGRPGHQIAERTTGIFGFEKTAAQMVIWPLIDQNDLSAVPRMRSC